MEIETKKGGLIKQSRGWWFGETYQIYSIIIN